MPVPALRGKSPRATLTALVVLTLAAAGVYAQSIKMPDFRQMSRETAPPLKPGEACDKCGVIRTIREIQSTRPVPVPQSVQSGPADRSSLGSPVYVGAVMALPMGEGTGKSYVGGVGTPEMRERFAESTYEITIRLDSGGYTSVQRRDGGTFRVGDRVRVSGIQLELLAP
jgi:outer membrane lipoprotein SlyB